MTVLSRCHVVAIIEYFAYIQVARPAPALAALVLLPDLNDLLI